MSYDIEHKMDTKHVISSYIEGKLIIFNILSTPSPQFNVDVEEFMKNIQKSDIMSLHVFIQKMITSYFLYVLKKIVHHLNIELGGRGWKIAYIKGKMTIFSCIFLKNEKMKSC